jgi:Concanavalin A-like lectin/glucanases superfamily
MKRLLQTFCLIVALPLAIRAADTNPPPRLTIELRDGSRVVGTSVEDTCRFRSDLLGDFKLPMKKIRSVDCVSTNSLKLTTVNGDELNIHFSDSQLKIKTGFGRIDLAADSIRKLAVQPLSGTGAHPDGLVALWSGENDGTDSVGHNDAQLMDMDFADGQIGLAFALNGFSSWMKIAANPVLDVGKGKGLTLSVWIKPSNVLSFRPILEWNAMEQCGVHLWLGHEPGQRGVLFANLVDDQGNHHYVESAPNTIVPGQFQHIALTYDKASGEAVLFVNGRIVNRENFGSFTPQTSYDLLVSRRPGDHPGDWTYNAFYSGLLDEISIYNRALTAEEIKSLCIQNNNGNIPPATTTDFSPTRIYRSNSGE